MSFRYLTDYLFKNHITYAEYLKSEHWRDVKDRFIKSGYKHRCFVCGRKDKLNLHHKTYRRIGKEYLTDLCWLCDDCHKLVHDREKPTRGTPKNGNVLWSAATILRRKYVKAHRCKLCKKKRLLGEYYCKEHLPH